MISLHQQFHSASWLIIQKEMNPECGEHCSNFLSLSIFFKEAGERGRLAFGSYPMFSSCTQDWMQHESGLLETQRFS